MSNRDYLRGMSKMFAMILKLHTARYGKDQTEQLLSEWGEIECYRKMFLNLCVPL